MKQPEAEPQPEAQQPGSKKKAPGLPPAKLATEYVLEWVNKKGEPVLGEAAAATNVASVGKTLVQLSAWTCTECMVGDKDAALFDVEFCVVPGPGTRLEYAEITVRLDDEGLKVLDLGPKHVQAKDPVETHVTIDDKMGLRLELKAGHAIVATGGVDMSHTSNASHKGLTYPCRVKASVAGESFARWSLYGNEHLGTSADLSLVLWIVLPTRNGPAAIPCKLDVEARVTDSGCFFSTRKCVKTNIPIQLAIR